MALRDWISGSGRIATANIATLATVGPHYPGKNRAVAVAVAENEKKDLTLGPATLQPERTEPDNSAVRKDLPLAPAICTNCKRFEMVDFASGQDRSFPGCLYPADGPDGWKRLPAGLKECIWDSLRSPVKIVDELPMPNGHRRESNKLSPTARAWLHDHRQKLRLNGWTAAELYRRNKFNPGIAWLAVWEKPGLAMEITSAGVIQFSFQNNGGIIKQTIRPHTQEGEGLVH